MRLEAHNPVLQFYLWLPHLLSRSTSFASGKLCVVLAPRQMLGRLDPRAEGCRHPAARFGRLVLEIEYSL